MIEYIDIDKTAIPYRFDMRLNEITWGFEVRYNSEYDFFTLDLYKGSELVKAGEKVIYGMPLFENLIGVKILPIDLSRNANRVGWEELGRSVLLYLEGEGYE